MLELFIKPERETIITRDNMQFRVYPFVFSKNGKLHDFRACNLAEINDIKFTIVFSQKTKKSLKIHPVIKNGIIKAINLHHNKKDLLFDCYAFTNLVFEIEQHKILDMKKFWRTKPRRFFLSVGDVIFLTNKADSSFYHSAIYIGYGLYISIYGAGGDLEISCLNDMKYDFEKAKKILIAKPYRQK
jgi:ADP-heptose:LPS heptosyltransferase